MIQFQDCFVGFSLYFKLVHVKAFCSLILNLLVFFSDGFIEPWYILKVLLCNYFFIALSFFIMC